MFGRKEKKARTILILGLGEMGYYLAKRLQHEEFSITVIEPDSERIKYGDETLDARLIKGEAMNISCWEEADAARADCLIAVTDNDAVNMMAAQIADKFGIPHKICRVRSRDFGLPDSLLHARDLKIDLLIHPEEITAQEISNLIKLHEANGIIDIAGGEIELLSVRVLPSSPFANKTLKEISRHYNSFDFRVVAIARGINTIIPGGDHEILPDDQIFVMANSENHKDIIEFAGVSYQRRQRVMILGGGLVGQRIAELLHGAVSIKLIEINGERAEELQDQLHHVEVLHGDGSITEALTMAGLKDMDTFIAATGENETNIMSCLLAKNMMKPAGKNGNGADSTVEPRTIAMVNKEDYLVLASSVGLDIALNRKIIASNEILKFIRQSELLSVVHLHSFDAEVVELITSKNAPVTKKPLSKIAPNFRDKIIVGGVHRDGNWNIAVGDTHIRENERVIVICTSNQLKEVRRLFAV